MINFFSEIEFELDNAEKIHNWISQVITSEGYEEGDISYIFCNDEYLHKINVQFLNHDTLTDIISFDYTMGKEVSGEIYISVERVRDNAEDFEVDFEEEMHRVMVHGVLHYCGYKDKSEKERLIMRNKEDEALRVLYN